MRLLLSPPSTRADVTSPAAPQTSSLIRPALALLAGLGIIVMIVGVGTLIATLAALRGVDPRQFHPTPVYLAAILTLTALGALAGGFATSRITADRSYFTVFVLGLLLFVSGVVPVLRGVPPTPGQPSWYPMALAVLSPIGVLLGGLLERGRVRSPRTEA